MPYPKQTVTLTLARNTALYIIDALEEVDPSLALSLLRQLSGLESSRNKPGPKPKPKRVLSPAALEAIRAAQRKRWAKNKRAEREREREAQADNTPKVKLDRRKTKNKSHEWTPERRALAAKQTRERWAKLKKHNKGAKTLGG